MTTVGQCLPNHVIKAYHNTDFDTNRYMIELLLKTDTWGVIIPPEVERSFRRARARRGA
jgi:hypothetical protein